MARRGSVATAIAAALVPACAPTAAGAHPVPSSAAVWSPDRQSARVARVVIATRVRARPGGRVTGRLTTQTAWVGAPLRLLVLRAARDHDGDLWLRVRLPARPNDAAGWIDANDVRVARIPWRVRVRTRSRTVTIYRDGRVTRRFRAVVGKPSTPTPHGLFAIYERARQPDPRAFLGPWALHLTAHSDVLFDYGGGPGRVAIHGRSGASLLDPLGTARSHGCIRVADRQIVWMARHLPAGTPVRVTG